MRNAQTVIEEILEGKLPELRGLHFNDAEMDKIKSALQTFKPKTKKTTKLAIQSFKKSLLSRRNNLPAKEVVEPAINYQILKDNEIIQIDFPGDGPGNQNDVNRMERQLNEKYNRSNRAVLFLTFSGDSTKKVSLTRI